MSDNIAQKSFSASKIVSHEQYFYDLPEDKLPYRRIFPLRYIATYCSVRT